MMSSVADDPLFDPTANAETVWAAPSKSPLLEEFQGRWKLDLETTLQMQEEAGIDLELVRPGFEWIIEINGHIVLFKGMSLEPELRLFAVHQHDGWVCGKGWDHEDRHDPGDMSKQHVRLKKDGDTLLIQTRSAQVQVDLSDPDFDSSMPVELRDSQTCPLNGDLDYGWSSWTPYSYAFVGN